MPVSDGEAVRFGRGEYQYGYNECDERVVALVVDAPRDSTAVKLACPDCGARSPPDPRTAATSWPYHCGECDAVISRMR